MAYSFYKQEKIEDPYEALARPPAPPSSCSASGGRRGPPCSDPRGASGRSDPAGRR